MVKKVLQFFFWCIVAAIICLLAEGAAGQGLPKGTKSGYVTSADGARIHYLEAGQTVRFSTKTGSRPALEGDLGGPILFVPGWTMTAEVWEHQISYFSKTRRVVAIDPRGQGDSDKPTEGYYPAVRARDIRTVIQQLKLAPVVMVGWSMGVTEVAAYVEQFGTAGLSGIVLVDGIAGLDADPAQRGAFMGFAANFLADREKQNKAFVRGMFRKAHPEAYYARIEEAALKTPTTVAVALIVGNFTSDYRPALAKINVPALVVVAGDDKSNLWMPRYRDVAQRIPGGRLEIMTDCGHAVFADDPAKFNALVVDFLQAGRKAKE